MAIQEKVVLGGWGLFLTSFSGNCGAKFSKEVVGVGSRQAVVTDFSVAPFS
jgi:hypothetical protein